MTRRPVAFYLRRTKEAKVYFPQWREDGTWAAMTKPMQVREDTPPYGGSS